MTEHFLHPELGSGALREALEPEVVALLKRVDEDAKGTRCLTMAEVTLCLSALKRLALSLSSPIEPRKEVRERLDRNVDSLRKHGTLAKPTSQASSEVREALESANGLCRSAMSIAKREGKDTNWETFRNRLAESLDRQHKVMYPALAPSRQGAAKRVEG